MSETSIGIIGYGAHLPWRRITADEYRKGWGGWSAAGVAEKTVMGLDEDAVTMSAAAGLDALDRMTDDLDGNWGLFAASPIWPDAEKSAAASLVEMLGLPSDTRPVQLGGSADCGLAALLAAWDFAAARPGRRKALVVTADAPPAKIGHPLEQAAGAAAAAFVIGPGRPMALVEGADSAVEDVLGARHRPAGEAFIDDIEVRAFTDEAMIRLSIQSARAVMDRLGRTADDYAYAVLPQFDLRTPLTVGARLGLAEEKIKPYLMLPLIGDAGAATTPLGLINVLEMASPGERVLVVGYGSGGESHAVDLSVGPGTASQTAGRETLSRALADKMYLTFTQYLKINRAWPKW